jgi:hypothetical protein
MNTFLAQLGMAVSQQRRERQVQVWLPSDTAPTVEWVPIAVTVTVVEETLELSRWEDDGGRIL